MMSAPLKNYGVHGPYMRFHPFDLEPGQVRLLFFEGWNCRSSWAGVTSIESGFTVRFRFLWRTTTTVVPLPEKVAITVPRGARCR